MSTDTDNAVLTVLLSTGDGSILGSVAEDVFDNLVRMDLAVEFLSDPRHHIAVALDGGVVVGMASAVHYVHPDKPAQLRALRTASPGFPIPEL
jgi:aminoglycoside 6'-N-acetyltransferase I